MYGRNEGGEHKQKNIKELLFKWTNKKPGCFRSLVNQLMEINIAAFHIFGDLCPEGGNVLQVDNGCWARKLGPFSAADSNKKCSCCRRTMAEGELLCCLSEGIDATKQCDIFKSQNMRSTLQSKFSYSKWSTEHLLKYFVRLDFEKLCCEECMIMSQVLFGLQFNVMTKFVW